MQERLIPIWRRGAKYRFLFTKEVHYNKNKPNKPNQNHHFIVELTKIDDTIEAYYSSGLLESLQYSINETCYLNAKKFTCLYYSIDKTFQIKEVRNTANLDKYLSLTNNKHLLTVKHFNDLICTDVNILHRFWGIEKPLQATLNFKQNQNYKNELLYAFSQKECALNLLQLEYLDTDTYQTEHLVAVDTTQNTKTYRFKLIQEDFTSGFFNIDNYDNIIFKHEKHIFTNNDSMVNSIVIKNKLLDKVITTTVQRMF